VNFLRHVLDDDHARRVGRQILAKDAQRLGAAGGGAHATTCSVVCQP